MHIISILTTMALLGVSTAIIGTMLIAHRHAIINALYAKPAPKTIVRPAGGFVCLNAAEVNVARPLAVKISRLDRGEYLALAA